MDVMTVIVYALRAHSIHVNKAESGSSEATEELKQGELCWNSFASGSR